MLPPASRKRSRAISGMRINPVHQAPETVARYRAAFASGAPFPHLAVQDVIEDSEALEAVKKGILGQEWTPKSNDLYSFSQSKDLRAIDDANLQALTTHLYSEEFRGWITAVTGVEVTDVVDMSSAVYRDASHLLCHDDDLAARRIAYILYLVPRGWDARDGGTLDLYSADADGNPDAIRTSLVPAWNSMAFFAVDSRSHHQVAEVLSDAKGPRMSISGWFHGAPVPRPPPKPLPAVVYRPPVDNGADIAHWIDLQYLHPDTVAAVREQFQKECAIELPQFIRPDRYAAVLSAAASQPWAHVGPANMRHYKRSPAALCLLDAADAAAFVDPGLCNNTQPDELARFMAFAHGTQFAEYIAALTGVQVTAVSGEARCFAHRDYTMVCDPEYRQQRVDAKRQRVSGMGAAPAGGAGAGEAGEADSAAGDETAGLDVTLSILPPFLPEASTATGAGGEPESGQWLTTFGGCVTYMTGDEELLTVVPRPNTLSLVLTEKSVLSFVKYVNHHAPCPRHDVALTMLVTGTGEDSDDDEDGAAGEE